jgi:hypothetical protein
MKTIISKLILTAIMVVSICISLVSAKELNRITADLSKASSILSTEFCLGNKGSDVIENEATCFLASITIDGNQKMWCFITNYHPFFLRDTKNRIIARVDSGIVYRNSKDTVEEIRVKIWARHPYLDLVLLKPTEDLPADSKIENMALQIEIKRDIASPLSGDKVIYCGFPLLIGQDKHYKRNYPSIIHGTIAQFVPDDPDFMIQAPALSGASGSPVISEKDNRFLGVAYSKIKGQESLFYAIKASEIESWIRKVIGYFSPNPTKKEKH